MNNDEEMDVWIKEILTRLKAIETTLINLEKSQPSNPQLSSSASFLRLNVLSSLN